jgi:HSP20 family protein
MTLNEMMPFRHGKGLVRRKEWESPIQALHDEMDDLFNNFFGPTTIEPFGRVRAERVFMPSVNVSEDDKEILVTAEVPGMDEKELDITITKDALSIKGEKKAENEEKGKNYYRMERSYGSFERVIPLAAEVEEGKAKASFKNGVLKVTLPKTAKAQATATKIKVTNE